MTRNPAPHLADFRNFAQEGLSFNTATYDCERYCNKIVQKMTRAAGNGAPHMASFGNFLSIKGQLISKSFLVPSNSSKKPNENKST